jgi:hypothetical protein
MTKLPPAQFLFQINQSNFTPFKHRREKWRNCTLRDFCFRSIGQILAHSDTVAKNDEISLARFLFPINQRNFSPFRHRREKLRNCPRRDICFRSISQIFAHSDTVAKNDEIPWFDFCLRLICQILANFDIVAKIDEIAPGTIFVSDQSLKF